VGHRVVHGGASLIHVDEMKKKITIFQLAPLHNPANLEGIHVASAFLHRQNKWLLHASIKQFL
jgi:acetate kinase